MTQKLLKKILQTDPSKRINLGEIIKEVTKIKENIKKGSYYELPEKLINVVNI